MRWCVAALGTAGLSLLAALAASGPPVDRAPSLPPPQVRDQLEVPPPPFSEGIFPCSDCHESMPVDRTRRPMTVMHDEIVFDHGGDHRWCLDCHNATERDSLHLASGELIPFEQSYLLCGQCHGEKLRDWRAGVHGRRTGEWQGTRLYLLCAHCHDPHKPRFGPLAPEPPPLPPQRSIR
jgi:hypothetical protein